MHETLLSVLAVYIVVSYTVATVRTGRVKTARISPDRRTELVNAAPPEVVFQRIRSIPKPYSVDDADPATTKLVLSSSPTVFTMGFFYPVFITPHETGSKIEVGIQSRFLQWGPLVDRAYDKCVDAIEQLLGVPAARVA